MQGGSLPRQHNIKFALCTECEFIRFAGFIGNPGWGGKNKALVVTRTFDLVGMSQGISEGICSGDAAEGREHLAVIFEPVGDQVDD